MFTEGQIKELLRKALSVDTMTGSDIQSFMKQDLEKEAYVQLYSSTEQDEMTLLKDLPISSAKQVNHEFTIVNHYGSHHAKTAFAANGLPTSDNIGGKKENVQLKLHGKTSQVLGLTVLQDTISAMGHDNIADANDEAVKNVLNYLFNCSLYASDTRLSLDQNEFKGVFQLIDEATRSGAAVGMYANGDIFIDLRGRPLKQTHIRKEAVGFKKRHGTLRRVYMAPEVNELLENDLDPAARFMITPQDANRGMIVGNSIDGMRVQGSIVYFRRDNALSTLVRCGTPNKGLIVGAPAAFTFGSTGAGSIAQPAVNNSSSGSKFTSTDTEFRLTGFVYQVVAVNATGDSIASNISAPVNAADGKTIEFAITPRGDEVSFKIYRGYAMDLAQPDTFLAPHIMEPQFIAEIPNGAAAGNTAPITFIDSNTFLPGTTHAWGTDVNSENASAIDRGEKAASLTNSYKLGKSSVALAELKGLFEFDLAKLGWLHSNKLFARVGAPMVPRPWVNVVWYNVGGVALKQGILDLA
ncbi:MAG: hypothetical protein ACXVCY_04220 [Pseudobdellovibrionaceae bacterium]